MKFKNWIIKNFLCNSDPYGDLAYDIKNDEDFAKRNDYEGIRNYLSSKGACTDCLNAFDEAYEEYAREAIRAKTR